MNQAGRVLLLSAFLAAAGLTAGPVSLVRADDTEQRDYEIRVADKPAGRSRLTIVEKDDGTTLVEGTADVKVKWLFVTGYTYSVKTNETWKNGRLVEMKCSSEEDRKKTEVEISAVGDDLRMWINGKRGNNVRVDVWPSSYWKLADAKYHNKAVPILDADTGREFTGQLQYVGTEKLSVGANLDDCYRFRITGIPVPIELWFDRYHRLVRQEFTESGQRTLVQLIGVRRY